MVYGVWVVYCRGKNHLKSVPSRPAPVHTAAQALHETQFKTSKFNFPRTHAERERERERESARERARRARKSEER